ncbi:methyl-accepting chemotaxis protein [Bradyrhizobium sp. SYSU BS000235]|uniref:methyl-accepting chemotaxis protein n=1 Tax=Bradyrhizobium sp. SYSU BS000235 TaxID=3411332 RepID=UPI003C75C315
MLDRVSATALLKSVIAAMAACVIILLATSAWQSWSTLDATSRIATIADASGQAFKAMHNLRTDRSSTVRTLNAEGTIIPEMDKYIRSIQDREMPALSAAINILGSMEFPEKGTLLPELSRLTNSLTSMQKEFWDAANKPKASRRAGLAKEYSETTTALISVLDKISNQLAALVNHANPVVDQLLSIKQMAWILRNTAGDASLLVSNGLGAGKVSGDAQLHYTKFVGGMDAAWSALESSAAGMKLPAALESAIAAAKTAYFDPQYMSLRDRLMFALSTGEKPELTAAQWSPLTVGRMASAVVVAEQALDAAKHYGKELHQDALRALIIQLILLSGAVAMGVLSIIAVSRRVIKPLQSIQDAMLKVASGDLSVDVPFAQRRDEIGALAGALETFKQNAVEKERIEADQRTRNARGASRQQAIEAHIGMFEQQIGEVLDAFSEASDQMRQTSQGMSAISMQTNTQVRQAAKASGDASANVQSVAVAAEELSASINDISRQVSHAANIAGRAVDQARQTDATVQGLSETASRIGDVISLINDIAGQTNLLALNATIEAARAGEAGKGFAVVASEVKSLASQTAKATEEISQQIAAVQKVTQEAMEAIKGIGGTISEVSEVATAIAAAVEEQGAATQEITRNTQQAAQGTMDVSNNIAGVTEGADATGASAENVNAAAAALGEQAQQLRGRVTEFLGNIRAA